MKVLAQQLNFPGGSIQGPQGFAFVNIGTILVKAIPYIFAFAGIFLLIMIVVSGLSLMTSAGDPKKAEAGKQRLTNALVGFFIIFTAYWLVQLFGRIFGVQEIINVFGG